MVGLLSRSLLVSLLIPSLVRVRFLSGRNLTRMSRAHVCSSPVCERRCQVVDLAGEAPLTLRLQNVTTFINGRAMKQHAGGVCSSMSVVRVFLQWCAARSQALSVSTTGTQIRAWHDGIMRAFTHLHALKVSCPISCCFGVR